MGAPTYGYDPQQLLDGVTKFQQANAAIQQYLAELHSYAVSQMADWNDEAKQMYDQHKAKWDQAANNMNSVLTQNAAPTMLRSLENYEITESTNRKRFVT